MNNPEFQAQCVRNGFFPSDKDLATDLVVKSAIFYELLLAEWENSGCRVIIRARVHALARQAGYAHPASAERTLERKRLLVLVRKKARGTGVYLRKVVARPYRTQGSKKILIPIPCTKQGVWISNTMWCLPKNTPPVRLSDEVQRVLYQSTLAVVLGCGTNRHTLETLFALSGVERKVFKEALKTLCATGLFRVVLGEVGEEQSVYQLIVRPYAQKRSFNGRPNTLCKVSPKLCQPESIAVDDAPHVAMEVSESRERAVPEIALSDAFQAILEWNTLSAQQSVDTLVAFQETSFRKMHALAAQDPEDPQIAQLVAEVESRIAFMQKRVAYLQERKSKIEALIKLFGASARPTK
jgi:hypothetical protein